MIDDKEDDIIEEREETEEEGEGEGKSSGSGSSAYGKTAPSEAFFSMMARLGASMDQISRILRSWRHLNSDQLSKKLNEFSKELPRASAQAQVEFDSKNNFAILHHFLSIFRPERNDLNLKAQQKKRFRPK